MTRTVADAALMLEHMAGYDPKDSTSANKPVDNYTAALNTDLTGLKIGLPKEYFTDTLDTTIADALQAAITIYEQAGASIQEVSLPHTKLSVPAYYVIAPAEASANLSRFDGVRYGRRCENPQNLEDLYLRTRAEGFGDEVKRRILTGTYALSAGYFDAYYRQAQKIRRLIKNDFLAAFNQVNVLLCPTTPDIAFTLGTKSSDPVQMYQEDIFTIPASLAGLPALSLPCGQKNGLPIGMQLIGNYFEEKQLLNAGHQFQQVTEWHRKIPAMN